MLRKAKVRIKNKLYFEIGADEVNRCGSRVEASSHFLCMGLLSSGRHGRFKDVGSKVIALFGTMQPIGRRIS